MGADLYIESISNKQKATYEPLFNAAVRARESNKDESRKDELQAEVSKYYDLMYAEGYFRDSYNITSVLKRLGLSWWKDVGPLLNKKGYLSPTKARKLL